MSDNQRLSEKNSPAPKRARKVLTLHTKCEILDRLRSGETLASIGRYYHINESSVRTIKQNENAIRESVAASAAKTAKITCMPRDSNIEKAEKALSLWIEDQTRKKVPLSSNMIRSKMLAIHKHLIESIGSSSQSAKNFQGSKGWFEKFKKRYSLHNLKIVGETASADHVAAANFPDELKKFISENSFVPDQVFNADETGLFWKRMPSRTFISTQEKHASGFKAAKDRVTILLCGNASGDCMIKPMLLYRSENPRALKGKSKEHLPVFWRSNRKAWVTSAVFMDWMRNCFYPEVEKYLRKKNLSFKVLLLLDNAPGHPVEELKKFHPKIEVLFFPPNTTSILQPLDQGVIKCFKSYYIRRTFARIHTAMEKDSNLTVTNCWKTFSIADCISVIKESVDEIKPSTINACWKKTWREAVISAAEESTTGNENEIDTILCIAHNIAREGFDDLREADIEELINCHNDELSEEDLLHLTDSTTEIEDQETNPKELTLTEANKLIKAADDLIDLAFEIDPNMDRSLKFKREVNTALQPYKEIQKGLQQKGKSRSILHYFKPVESSATSLEPVALSDSSSSG